MNNVNEDDIFEGWIATGTVRTEEVDLYADEAGLKKLAELYARQDELVAEIAQSEDDSQSTQRAVGEKSAVARLKKQLNDVEKQISEIETRVDGSKSTWTMRALREEEIQEIKARHPLPSMPTPTQEQLTTDKGKARWEKIRQKYERDISAVNDARVLDEIALSCTSVETARGKSNGVSVERLHGILKAEYGGRRIAKLSNAKNRATNGESEIPRPFSRSSSEEDPT